MKEKAEAQLPYEMATATTTGYPMYSLIIK